jgi:hypothetical protein
MTEQTVEASEDAAAAAFREANQHNFAVGGGADVAVVADDEDARDEGTIELLPPRQPVNLGVLETLRDHVSAMRDAKFFADGVCYTSMVPQRYQGKPGDGAAAILFGAEVGLSPIASLRSVIVIHGQPGFEARTMKAICKSHGYRFRTIEKTATRAEIWAWEPDSPYQFDADGKRINPDEEAVWTIDDARQAGYVPTADGKGGWEVNSNGKFKGNMKYIETPKIMLDAKVTAEVCRAIAPHILLGLPYAAEELEDFSDDDDHGMVPVARPARRARGVNRLRERAAEARQPEVVDAETDTCPPADEVTTAAHVEGPAGPPVAHMPEPPLADTIEPAPEPAAEPAVKQTAAAAPAPAPTTETAGAGMTADKGGERAAETGTPPPAPAPGPLGGGGDVAMSPAVRAKGERLLAALLDEAKLEGDDRLLVVAEIAAKWDGAHYHAVKAIEDLSNGGLKGVVDALQGWKAKGKLYDYCGEALNAASLREAGMLEGDVK